MVPSWPFGVRAGGPERAPGPCRSPVARLAAPLSDLTLGSEGGSVLRHRGRLLARLLLLETPPARPGPGLPHAPGPSGTARTTPAAHHAPTLHPGHRSGPLLRRHWNRF